MQTKLEQDPEKAFQFRPKYPMAKLYFAAALCFGFLGGLIAYREFLVHYTMPSSSDYLLRAETKLQMHKSQTVYQAPHLDSNRVAVLIEPRVSANMPALILHYLSVLGPKWPVHIYHSAANADLLHDSRALSQYLPSGRIVLELLHQNFSAHSAVSTFLTGIDFWEGLSPYEHILLFQLDAILCSASEHKVEDFFAYDFVGAPIAPAYTRNVVGYYNGGLSLRRRSKMLEVLTKYNFTAQPAPRPDEFEDQWFVHQLRHSEIKGILPAVEVARNFSMETIFTEGALGVHQADRWAASDWPEGSFETLQTWCPEIALTRSGGPATFDAGS